MLSKLDVYLYRYSLTAAVSGSALFGWFALIAAEEETVQAALAHSLLSMLLALSAITLHFAWRYQQTLRASEFLRKLSPAKRAALRMFLDTQ